MQIGQPFFLPEINLAIGRSQYISGNIQRQVLYWYDQQGNRYQTPEEVEQQTRQQLELVRQKLECYRQQFG
ncbi:hypothetical protein [Nostoc sp.]|uniref:hypothetical protein n=1 Tax=Nostoc sp. TaxID=1180 RepID=UPI002FFACBCF